MAQICIGCGVKLQTEQPNKAGFVPPSALNKEAVKCKRCFKITHYNEMAPVEMTDDDFLRTLHRIGETDGLIVNLIDLFDVNGSWISGLPRFVNNNPILLVANKIDLFPKSINLNRVRNWLQQQAKEAGIKPIHIEFISAEKGTGIDRVMAAIEDLREGRDVYVVGVTNVGKSTFINQMLKRFQVDEKELLTTSRFPGTTLDLVEIPLQEGERLFDTPGIINRNQMAHYVSPKELKLTFPTKTVKPKVFQLNDQQTLFFGGLARLDYVSGERQSFVCYMSNELNIHRTKLEKADELYDNHLGEMLSPPSNEYVDEWPGLVKHRLTISDEPTDIVFAGLGWVTVKGARSVIDAYAPENVGVLVRKALI